jgi:hypothetical protein
MAEKSLFLTDSGFASHTPPSRPSYVSRSAISGSAESSGSRHILRSELRVGRPAQPQPSGPANPVPKIAPPPSFAAGSSPRLPEGTFFLFQSHPRVFLSNPPGGGRGPILRIPPIATHSMISTVAAFLQSAPLLTGVRLRPPPFSQRSLE